MNMPVEQQRQIFAHWLRTGRRLIIAPSSQSAAKFNPWHDRATGQFTFRGGGSSFGGGAGASGSWPRPAPAPVPKAPAKPPGQSLPRSARPAVPAAAPASQRRTVKPPALRVVTRNGYEYRIDDQQRTVRVSGNLTIDTTSPRSRTIQARAGGPDRLPSDDGGHYIAPRFNGPAEAFNHFAQDSNLNRGRYRALEDQWARAKGRGGTVTVRITSSFEGRSQRPAKVDVYFVLNGTEQSVSFPNRRKRRSS